MNSRAAKAPAFCKTNSSSRKTTYARMKVVDVAIIRQLIPFARLLIFFSLIIIIQQNGFKGCKCNGRRYYSLDYVLFVPDFNPFTSGLQGFSKLKH